MSEYTPNTEAVREQYTREQPPHIGTASEKSAEFDRWYAAEIAAAKAEALREASRAVPFPIDPYGGFDYESLRAAYVQITNSLRDRADQISEGDHP